MNSVKSLYEQLVNELSLKQYSKLMGGDMTYKSKAKRAKTVSKSKIVHALANTIIELVG